MIDFDLGRGDWRAASMLPKEPKTATVAHGGTPQDALDNLMKEME
jgi:hypothetical protein